MNKIIIQNDSDLSMVDCLRLVEGVIKHGRVSNNDTQYAYLTAFSAEGKDYHIVTDLNKHSDKFTIYNVSPGRHTQDGRRSGVMRFFHQSNLKKMECQGEFMVEIIDENGLTPSDYYDGVTYPNG